jgi:glucose-1-phosphate thymidylyltransferase
VKKYKGIILAGGEGTRLRPLTSVLSKQLLPVYDKPMIFYPLSVLMLAGIKEILIISSKDHIHMFKDLLGDGSRIGLSLDYKVQLEPRGIAEAFILAEDFIGDNSCSLILGDNIFYGPSFTKLLKTAMKKNIGAEIFTYPVKNPEDFGVLKYDQHGSPIDIVEKPSIYISNLAITGLYFFDNDCIELSKKIVPSKRGELEITSLLNMYLKDKNLSSNFLGRGFAWLDTGSHDSLMDAGLFVKTIENRQGQKIACIEEIAYNNGWIDEAQLKKQVSLYKKTEYGNYLKSLLESNL